MAHALEHGIVQEFLLQQQLSDLSGRLAAATSECERLKSGREELHYQIRHVHDTLVERTGAIMVACWVAAGLAG